VATPVVSAPANARAGQRVKMSGTGFRAGTPVRIVFEAARHVVVGSTVARPDGTFKASIVVPSASAGRHRVQVVGINASGQPITLTTPVVVLASAAVLTSSAPSLDEPFLLTLSLLVPMATWLALEMAGWRRRRSDKQTTST